MSLDRELTALIRSLSDEEIQAIEQAYPAPESASHVRDAVMQRVAAQRSLRSHRLLMRCTYAAAAVLVLAGSAFAFFSIARTRPDVQPPAVTTVTQPLETTAPVYASGNVTEHSRMQSTVPQSAADTVPTAPDAPDDNPAETQPAFAQETHSDVQPESGAENSDAPVLPVTDPPVSTPETVPTRTAPPQTEPSAVSASSVVYSASTAGYSSTTARSDDQEGTKPPAVSSTAVSHRTSHVTSATQMPSGDAVTDCNTQATAETTAETTATTCPAEDTESDK